MMTKAPMRKPRMSASTAKTTGLWALNRDHRVFRTTGVSGSAWAITSAALSVMNGPMLGSRHQQSDVLSARRGVDDAR